MAACLLLPTTWIRLYIQIISQFFLWTEDNSKLSQQLTMDDYSLLLFSLCFLIDETNLDLLLPGCVAFNRGCVEILTPGPQARTPGEDTALNSQMDRGGLATGHTMRFPLELANKCGSMSVCD